MKQTVLVAENVEKTRAEFCKWIKEMSPDWEVRGAGSHEEVDKVLKEWKPSLALLDIYMPSPPGTAEVKEFADSMEALKKIGALVIVTTAAFTEQPPPPKPLGHAFLMKPILQETLEKTIREVLAKGSRT